ncbi:MAG: hypothetical protein LUD81_01735 [Clostridiales bacterium]|nr:hypothetical protein [Clostridiales bacterium]
MYDSIVERLTALGFSYDSESDDTLLIEEAERAKAFILSFCNLNSIPAAAEPVYIDIVCGYFLRNRLYNGNLSESGISDIVGKITEGDVSVEYASDKSLSLYEKADRLISSLIDRKAELLAFRKIKWQGEV